MLKKILLKIWFFYSSVIFFSCMFIFLPLSAFALVFGEKLGRYLSCFFLKSWGFLFSLLIGIIYRVKNKEETNTNLPAVFISNHRSFLDTPAAFMAINTRFMPLGKVEMKKVPFFGWFYPKVVVVINRNSFESRKKSMLEMRKKLIEGTSIFIFPEGSMNRTEKHLTDFYEGAFQLAIDAQVSIIPIIISNTAKILPPYKTNVFPGIVNIEVLEAISTINLKREDIDEIKSKTFKMMLEVLENNQKEIKEKILI